MADYEIYKAVADEGVSAELLAGAGLAKKAAPAAATPFTIEVRFAGGLNKKQKNAFKAAADRWVTVIVGDVPSVNVDGEIIDDVVIMAQGSAIDGPGKILGQAGPTHVRPANAGKFAFIPAKGVMAFDTADLAAMESKGTLNDVITHEMGHVLGIGTIWKVKKLLTGEGTTNPLFTGKQAAKEYGALLGKKGQAVPVENMGGPGTRDSHWREAVFHNELMTGFVGAAGNPMSRLTVGSLQDMGYVVNLDKAEPFTMPNLVELAAAGMLMASAADGEDGFVLPSVPIVLPSGALV